MDAAKRRAAAQPVQYARPAVTRAPSAHVGSCAGDADGRGERTETIRNDAMATAHSDEDVATAVALLGGARAAASHTAARSSADALAAALAKIEHSTGALPQASSALPVAPPPPSAHLASPQELIHAALAKSGAASTCASCVDGSTAHRAAAERTGATASALDAYQRRQREHGVREGGMGEGTVSERMRQERELELARRGEAKYRDKHAFVGEHWNDI